MEELSTISTKYFSPAAQASMKHALSAWAKQNRVRPRDFARQMGYSPSYGWSLLRGTAPVTIPTLGLFLLRYGVKAADELLEVFRTIHTGEIFSTQPIQPNPGE